MSTGSEDYVNKEDNNPTESLDSVGAKNKETMICQYQDLKENQKSDFVCSILKVNFGTYYSWVQLYKIHQYLKQIIPVFVITKS